MRKRQIVVNGEDVKVTDEFGNAVEEEEFDEAVYIVASLEVTVECKRSFDIDRVIEKVRKVDERVKVVTLDDWQEIETPEGYSDRLSSLLKRLDK